MLNGSRTQWTSGTYYVVPSYRHFSKIFNNTTLYVIYSIVTWILIICTFASSSHILPIILAPFVLLEIKMLVHGKEINAKVLSSIVNIENLFHRISKENRKEFRKYIDAIYNDPDDYELRVKTEHLFEEHAVIPTKIDTIKDSLDQDLLTIKTAKQIYNESLGKQ